MDVVNTYRTQRNHRTYVMEILGRDGPEIGHIVPLGSLVDNGLERRREHVHEGIQDLAVGEASPSYGEFIFRLVRLGKSNGGAHHQGNRNNPNLFHLNSQNSQNSPGTGHRSSGNPPRWIR